MSGLDDERLNAIREHAAKCSEGTIEWLVMAAHHYALDVPWLLSSLAAVSADRDREAERADKAEALLTAYAVAYWSGMSFEAHSDILDWYTDAAMKAGQQ